MAKCQKTGIFSDLFFHSGYKQLAVKIVKYLSEGPFVNSYDADFEALLKTNLKMLMSTFTLWNNIFNNVDQFYNVNGSSDDTICQQLNLANNFCGIR